MTDIRRSKAFSAQLFGTAPGSDFSDEIDDPTIHDDPWRTYGGCSFVLSLQDPDDINLELAAPRPSDA